MTPVAALASTARQHPHDRQLVDLALRSAAEASEIAGELVQVVLQSFSQLGRGDETIEARGSVESTVQAIVAIQKAMRPDLSYLLEGSADGAIAADAIALRLVLTNLILNAEAASPAGGTILIRFCSTWNTDIDQASGAIVEIEVRDEGTGMAATALQTLEPDGVTGISLNTSYNRNDQTYAIDSNAEPKDAYRSGSGASAWDARPRGLGLTICRMLVRQWGGTMTIRSTPGVGTAVTVRVPVRASNGLDAA
jgi:two-component system sensor histidine kinase EvgS